MKKKEFTPDIADMTLGGILAKEFETKLLNTEKGVKYVHAMFKHQTDVGKKDLWSLGFFTVEDQQEELEDFVSKLKVGDRILVSGKPTLNPKVHEDGMVQYHPNVDIKDIIKL